VEGVGVTPSVIRRLTLRSKRGYTYPDKHETAGVNPVTDIQDQIAQQIADHPILIYMKGSPDQPRCGFSAQASQALMACGKPFAFIDILSNPEIRAQLPQYSEWPTFPQLFVQGELVGGCDIITEMYQSGELQTLINEVPEEAVE